MFTTIPSSKMGDSMQEVLATASAGSSRTALPGEPPAGPGLAADAQLEAWFSRLPERLGELRIFDCHTHLGCADPDGSCYEVDELLDALAAVDGRAVGRGAARRGAAGIKLHPRAEQFRMSDPAVRRIFALADERRLPILVHAGRGIPSLGRDALQLARTYPHAPVILAHAAIADLGWIWREAAGQANLFFDTAWWNTADQLALFALVPPRQIVFASDTPYGRTIAAASVVPRAALTAGLSAEQIWTVAGGQLERLLPGADPLDVRPAPAAPIPGPGPLLERIYTLLGAAAARLTAGYPAQEHLELARLASELPADHPDAPVATSVRELLDRHARYLATDPPRRGPRVPGIHLIFVAAAVARTPGLPLPTT